MQSQHRREAGARLALEPGADQPRHLRAESRVIKAVGQLGRAEIPGVMAGRQIDGDGPAGHPRRGQHPAAHNRVEIAPAGKAGDQRRPGVIHRAARQTLRCQIDGARDAQQRRQARRPLRRPDQVLPGGPAAERFHARMGGERPQAVPARRQHQTAQPGRQHADTRARLHSVNGGHQPGQPGPDHDHAAARRRRDRPFIRRPGRQTRRRAGIAGRVQAQNAAVDHLVQQELAQVLAPQQRAAAFEALRHKSAQRVDRRSRGKVARLPQDTRRPHGAEAALAWPHAQAQIAPQIVQGRDVIVGGDGRLKLRAGDHLALADQRAGHLAAFQQLQAVAQRVVAPLRASRQRLGSGRAGGVHAQPGADVIGRLLRHQAGGSQLAAQHGGEARPVADDGKRALEAAPLAAFFRRARRLIQRAHTRPGAQRPRAPEAGDQRLAFVQHLAHFPGFDPVVIRAGDGHRCRADHADRAHRHQDVAVIRRAQAVDDRVDPADVHGNHHAPAPADAQIVPGQRRDLARPGAAGVEHPAGIHNDSRSVRAAQRRPHPIRGIGQAGHPVIEQEARAEALRRAAEGMAEVKAIDRPIRHEEGADQVRPQGRLPAPQGGDGDPGRFDAGSRAGGYPLIGVIRGILRRGNKDAARVFHNAGGDPAQDAVFGNAFAGRFGVAHGIAPAGVQQPVKAAGSPGGQVAPVGQDHAQPATGQIVGGAHAGRPAADHQRITCQVCHMPPPCAVLMRPRFDRRHTGRSPHAPRLPDLACEKRAEKLAVCRAAHNRLTKARRAMAGLANIFIPGSRPACVLEPASRRSSLFAQPLLSPLLRLPGGRAETRGWLCPTRRRSGPRAPRQTEQAQLPG